jgi:hypothetical protein
MEDFDEILHRQTIICISKQGNRDNFRKANKIAAINVP